MEVNLNDHIKVKLSDYGKSIHRQHYAYTKDGVYVLGNEPKVDDDGYTEYQLWIFIKIFGSFMSMGRPDPLETLNVIIGD